MNPNHIDLTSLRVFVAVTQAGSISAAGFDVSLSTAAVSKRISELEAIAGSQLFLRTSSGMQLTPAGHALLQHALEVQQTLERMARNIEAFSKGIAGHVRVMATSSSLLQGLPESLRGFTEQFPSIRLEFEERLSGDVVRGVTERRADVGIFTDNVPHDGLAVHAYDEDEMVLISCPGHPMTQVAHPSLSEALKYDFVSQYDSTTMNHSLALAAAESGVPLKLGSLVRGYDSVCRMVAAGVGLGLVPASFPLPQTSYGELVSMRLSDAWVKRRLLIGVRDTASLTAAARAFCSHVLGAEFTPQ